MAATALRILCGLFCLALCTVATLTSSGAAKRSEGPQKRFVVYLTGQHNVVPELSLVSRVTHVALAFMRSEVFNVPQQSDWPLFITIADVRAKFAKGTKIQVAIGGWGNTDGFSQAAQTDESRRLFAGNIKAMIDATGADGVDIDWEYPGGNGEDYKQIPNSEKTWETDAYPELLAEIRAAIGPSKLLTAAVPGLERDMLAFTENNLPKIYKSVDFLNVMTYDLVNRRDTITDHHSGLHGSIKAIHPYLTSEEAGHTQNLNIGLGFYVRWYKTAAGHRCDKVPAIHCQTELMEDPITGADLGKSGAFSWHDEVPAELADSFARALKFGEDDMSGGLLRGHFYMDKRERIFWSWDTAHTIVKKLEDIYDFFAAESHGERQGVGGVFAWGLGEDAPRFEHLEAVNKLLDEWNARISEHQEL
ncbi:hypothetical protein E8E12_005418 [Didymella heteroderae]|uniref:chitinase n=1 Tax=Didymella heteroderae TaxID=1769908 RepID=A0A9P4WM04_9PLEO|nr:hypothetical protein E8E12_005418 [Didymella heteroderae]